MEKMNIKVAVYIPSTININKHFNNKEYLQLVLKVMAECFGGATQQRVLGAWISGNKEIVQEGVNIVYSYCTISQYEQYIAKIKNLCEFLKNELQQEAISLEITKGSELQFI